MKLSIVIPCYNHMEYVGECLNSIVTQSRLPDECIVVNDGSTDGSVGVIEEYQKNYPFIKILHNPRNLGVHATVNRGVEEAKGEWIAIIACDEFFMPAYFAHALRAIEKHPDAGICCGDYCTYESDNRQFHKYKFLPLEKEILMHPSQFVELCRSLDVYIPSTASMSKRELLLEYGLYKRSLESLADYYLVYQVAFRHPVLYVPHVFTTFRYVKGSYGDKIRFNFSKRISILSSLIQYVSKEEDLAFQKSIHRSRILVFGGCFLIFFLALSPRYWLRLFIIAPFIVRAKIKIWLAKKEGSFGPIHRRLFFFKSAIKTLANL